VDTTFTVHCVPVDIVQGNVLPLLDWMAIVTPVPLTSKLVVAVIGTGVPVATVYDVPGPLGPATLTVHACHVTTTGVTSGDIGLF
jgi:hypothetical protein